MNLEGKVIGNRYQIIEKIGKRKSLILANSLLSIYVILIIMINSIYGLLTAYFIMSFCFAIKNVALIKDTKQINYLYLYHFLLTILC